MPVPQPDRRKFLLAAAAAAAGAAGHGADPSEAEARRAFPAYDGEIVDTHLHLWDLVKVNPPWQAELTGEGKEALGRKYTMAEFAEAAKGLRVTKAVYMEVDVAPKDQRAEADYVFELCGKGIMRGAVIGGRPGDPGFKDYLDGFRDNRFLKGVRQVLHVNDEPEKTCLTDEFVRGVRLLGERGLSFDLCFRPHTLSVARELIDKCPGTRFILDHMGNPLLSKDPPAWEAEIGRLAERKNLIACKISGMFAHVKRGQWKLPELQPPVNRCLSAFGTDRCIFAGDWPVVNLGGSFAEWFNTVQMLLRSRSDEDRRKIFHDNAVRLYGL
jgi:predicted TIM-barrel fold metal-dependent hydrolase